MPIRRPAKMLGSAAGSTMKRSSWRLPPPTMAPARIRLRSQVFTPWIVLSRIGKKAPRNTRKIAGLLAMPNQMMASGIHDTGGIGRSVCSVGSMITSTVRDQPMATPTDTASAVAMAKPARTRDRLASSVEQPVAAIGLGIAVGAEHPIRPGPRHGRRRRQQRRRQCAGSGKRFPARRGSGPARYTDPVV